MKLMSEYYEKWHYITLRYAEKSDLGKWPK